MNNNSWFSVQQRHIFCHGINGIFRLHADYVFQNNSSTPDFNIAWIHFEIIFIITIFTHSLFPHSHSDGFFCHFHSEKKWRKKTLLKSAEWVLRCWLCCCFRCCVGKLITDNDLIVPFKYGFFSSCVFFSLSTVDMFAFGV